MKISISILLGLTLTIFGCTKEVKNNQTSTTGTKTHTLKYTAESPVKTFVRYENSTGAKVDEYFTGNWQYEAQIEIQYNDRFDAYLYLSESGENKITGKILIDGKVVQEGTSTAGGVSCSYTVE